MNIKSMAGAHEVQKVLKLGLSSIQDDLAIVSDPHSRAGDKAASIKRLQHSVSRSMSLLLSRIVILRLSKGQAPLPMPQTG